MSATTRLRSVITVVFLAAGVGHGYGILSKYERQRRQVHSELIVLKRTRR